MLLLVASAATVASLAIELPAQNAVFALTSIAVIEGVLENINNRRGLPFGHVSYLLPGGPLAGRIFPWAVGIFWAVVLLNARGVARFLLQRWRANPNYGFGVLGLTTLLVLGFDLALEPIGVWAAAYWRWDSAGAFGGWFGVPIRALLGRGLSTLIIMALVVPLLINKRPVETAPSSAPVLLSCSILLLFLLCAAVCGLWFVAGICLTEFLVIAWMAWPRPFNGDP